jgi:hypothetical protein
MVAGKNIRGGASILHSRRETRRKFANSFYSSLPQATVARSRKKFACPLDEVRESVLELYSVAYVVGFERGTSITRSEAAAERYGVFGGIFCVTAEAVTYEADLPNMAHRLVSAKQIQNRRQGCRRYEMQSMPA